MLERFQASGYPEDPKSPKHPQGGGFYELCWCRSETRGRVFRASAVSSWKESLGGKLRADVGFGVRALCKLFSFWGSFVE